MSADLASLMPKRYNRHSTGSDATTRRANPAGIVVPESRQSRDSRNSRNSKSIGQEFRVFAKGILQADRPVPADEPEEDEDCSGEYAIQVTIFC